MYSLPSTSTVKTPEQRFGYESGDYDFDKRCYKNNNFDGFWTSGGNVCRDKDWSMWAEEGKWELCLYDWEKVDDKHPQWVIDIFPELIEVFNENVPYGCCGGCI